MVRENRNRSKERKHKTNHEGKHHHLLVQRVNVSHAGTFTCASWPSLVFLGVFKCTFWPRCRRHDTTQLLGFLPLVLFSWFVVSGVTDTGVCILHLRTIKLSFLNHDYDSAMTSKILLYELNLTLTREVAVRPLFPCSIVSQLLLTVQHRLNTKASSAAMKNHLENAVWQHKSSKLCPYLR